MSGRNAWTSSRERMGRFPELLARCSREAAAYGKCVVSTTTGKQELRKDLCLKEFKALKTCFISASEIPPHNEYINHSIFFLNDEAKQGLK